MILLTCHLKFYDETLGISWREDFNSKVGFRKLFLLVFDSPTNLLTNMLQQMTKSFSFSLRYYKTIHAGSAPCGQTTMDLQFYTLYNCMYERVTIKIQRSPIEGSGSSPSSPPDSSETGRKTREGCTHQIGLLRRMMASQANATRG